MKKYLSLFVIAMVVAVGLQTANAQDAVTSQDDSRSRIDAKRTELQNNIDAKRTELQDDRDVRRLETQDNRDAKRIELQN